MANNSKKRYLLGIAIIIVGLFLFFLGRTHAQVVATNIPQNGGICRILASQAENVYAWQNAVSGNIQAITGTYNVNLTCNPTDAGCQSLSTALNTALDAGNSINGFPQYTSASSNNSINVVLGVDSSVCGTRSDGSIVGACTEPVQTPQGVVATIYINTSSSDMQVSLNDPAIFACVIEHEMSHAFGLDDTYSYLSSSVDQGLMGNGCNDDPPATWQTDPLTVSAIKEVNAAGGARSTLGCQQYVCPYGFTPTSTPDVPVCAQTSCTASELLNGAVNSASSATGCVYPTPTMLPYLPLSPDGSPVACTDAELEEGYVNDSVGNCVPPTPEVSAPIVPTSTACTTDQLSSGNYVNDATAPGGCRELSHPVTSSLCGIEGYPDCPTSSLPTCLDDNGNIINCSTDTSSTISTSSEICDDDSTPNANGLCADGSTPTSTTTDYCSENPTDPDCVSYCASNPTDPSCIGTDNPVNDPDYCTEYPQDPSCIGTTGSNNPDDCTLNPVSSICLDCASDPDLLECANITP
jgi:hypothetical protein